MEIRSITTQYEIRSGFPKEEKKKRKTWILVTYLPWILVTYLPANTDHCHPRAMHARGQGRELPGTNFMKSNK
jgi:hypothetical protein